MQIHGCCPLFQSSKFLMNYYDICVLLEIALYAICNLMVPYVFLHDSLVDSQMIGSLRTKKES